MSSGHSSSDSKIPVMPLVDILFSAFAGVLATATVAIAMMRTSEPDKNLPVLPHLTVIAAFKDAGCAKTLRPTFLLTPPGESTVTFADFTMANVATNAGDGGRLNAWYFADTDQSKSGSVCLPSQTCVQAELTLLTGDPGLYSVRPGVTGAECGEDVQVALLLGPPPHKVEADLFRGLPDASAIEFEILEP